MAVGESGAGPAYALTYSGGTWSSPSVIDSEGNNAMHSVSCASASFCVTVGNYGDTLTYNGSTWSGPKKIGILGYIQSVSCHSESFCVAETPGGEAAAYNGTTWSVTGPINERASSGAVACPAESFCLAVGGYSSTYNGSIWTSPAPVGGGGLTSVSCSSPSLCTAVDYHGRALTYNGSGWSAPAQIDAEGGLRSVSCPVASFCAAVGGYPHGHALTYNGAVWSAPSEVDPESSLDSVSCVSASFCAAVGTRTVEGHEHGYGLTYNSGGWTAPAQIDPGSPLSSVSCASESLCVAVGGHDAVIYDGSKWGAPSQIYPEGSLKGVSCPSSSFCVAVAERFTSMGVFNSGQALTYNGSAWGSPSEIPHAPNRGPSIAGSVSCVSSAFCMTAARFEGAASIFEAGAWSAWNSLEVNGQFSSVSCPSVSFCAVVDEVGQAFIYGSPPAAPPATGAGGTTGSGSPSMNPPIEKGKPRVNTKTGEITFEYDFPEPGVAEAYGEVMNKTATGAKHERSRKCRGGYIRKGKKCVKVGPTRYGRTTLAIATAGTYKLHIRPSTKVLAALKTGKTLTVRLSVVFTPTGTTAHISNSTTIRVRLKRALQSRHHAGGKR
jgi:hypothetical protein